MNQALLHIGQSRPIRRKQWPTSRQCGAVLKTNTMPHIPAAKAELLFMPYLRGTGVKPTVSLEYAEEENRVVQKLKFLNKFR